MYGRQFVILEHDYPFLHWDFLIEDGGGLASWRLLELPQSGIRVSAASLPVHRPHYLNWEGPISGDRGSVRRIHKGLLALDHVWPDVTEWPGLFIQMDECPLADSCRLMRHDDGTLNWKFD